MSRDVTLVASELGQFIARLKTGKEEYGGSRPVDWTKIWARVAANELRAAQREWSRQGIGGDSEDQRRFSAVAQHIAVCRVALEMAGVNGGEDGDRG